MKRALVQAAHRVTDVFCVVFSSHSEKNTRKRRRLRKTEDLTFDPADRYSCQPAPVKPKKKRGRKKNRRLKICPHQEFLSETNVFLSRFFFKSLSSIASVVLFWFFLDGAAQATRVSVSESTLLVQFPKNKKDK